MGGLGEIQEKSGLTPSELLRGPTVPRQTNPKSGTCRPVNPDSVEPEIGIARSNRPEGKEQDMNSLNPNRG